MKPIIFVHTAFKDFTDWNKTDKKIFKKIVDLIQNIDSTPFEGIGNPEPLKHHLSRF